MRVVQIKIENFRGIRETTLIFPKYGVLIGDNNCGKTTILEALDLVLGPDRLNRKPAIDEYDFFQCKYTPPKIIENEDIAENSEHHLHGIKIEVIIADLTDEQRAKFGDYIEFWDNNNLMLYDLPKPEGVDDESISDAVRVTFHGYYDCDDDDFEGKTYFTRTLNENETPVAFSKRHKQLIGFLYLRSIRTGSRALSMERGSLLDIIMRIKEVRPKMWENTIRTISDIEVAADTELGISPILGSINEALQKYVPREWGVAPQLKVSNLTREHLRKIITAFMATGNGEHIAPFYRQGTGTVNMLVLALLSQIAEEKRNVIFAMEEPETAIPPYAQKRIIHEVRRFSDQAIFTSHSPYVLEEFSIEENIVLSNSNNIVSQKTINLPHGIKQKMYKQNYRTRFCEGLLSRRVLIAEGFTEATAFPAACRRLEEIDRHKYSSLETLGITIIDAGGETKIPEIAELYKSIGKKVYVICDLQNNDNKLKIEKNVDFLMMHDEKGLENVVIKNVSDDIIERFINNINFSPETIIKYPDPRKRLLHFFVKEKGNWGIADFIIELRTEDEFPQWIKNVVIELKRQCMSDEMPELGSEAMSDDFN